MSDSPSKPARAVISPSILAADFGRLADEARRVADAGADSIHIDIMDGHFVPNLTLGPRGVAAINRAVNLFLDVHLMVYTPFDYIETFIAAGADRITFHIEATEDVMETIEFVRRCHVEVGLAFRPETSASLAVKYLDVIDLILLMTVSPGFGGQEFMPEVLEKIELVAELCDRLTIARGHKVKDSELSSGIEKAELPKSLEIQVDGGINLETIALCATSGATNFVSGTALFSSADLKIAVSALRSAASYARHP